MAWATNGASSQPLRRAPAATSTPGAAEGPASGSPSAVVARIPTWASTRASA
jgi:hypothetical protein